jgi:CheY-like chemotaxis protein
LPRCRYSEDKEKKVALNIRKKPLRKILVVDDDAVDRALLRKILGKSYIIIEAEGGEEAIDLACREKPSLILLDIMMPQVDGYSACDKLKRNPRTTKIPVVMLTGVSHSLNVRLAEELNAAGYITKPFNPQELPERINEFL